MLQQLSLVKYYEILKESNCLLKSEKSELKLVSKREKETIAILEEKVAKAEAAALKSFKKSNIELSTLNKADKSLNNNLEEVKRERSLRTNSLS